MPAPDTQADLRTGLNRKRRELLLGGGAVLAAAATPALAAAAADTAKPGDDAKTAGTVKPASAGNGRFPKGFLWGAATAGHQVEGNNTSSDLWFLEHLQPTVFAEPSGDACNSFELWATDLDLARQLGLNCYRFSLEWSRIEPEPGQYSIAMLDHYLRIIEGCHTRGLTPVVTFNHFTTPRWFAADGGWLHAESPGRFARFCEQSARHLAPDIGYATTLNEPNIMRLLKTLDLPQGMYDAQRATLAAAAKALGVAKFSSANVCNPEDHDALQEQLLKAHTAGRNAIKSVRPSLPVGLSLAMADDQAIGADTGKRDAKREYCYGAWLELARSDDFFGVQNYERTVYDANGKLPPPAGVPRNAMGSEIYPRSLEGAVRYAHQATGRPILVTENGLGTDDDALRAAYVPAALAGLKAAIDSGVPVRGYVHWSLLDNFEWIFGYRMKYGLYSVDRQTFRRTAKPSAGVYGAIARRNAL